MKKKTSIDCSALPLGDPKLGLTKKEAAERHKLGAHNGFNAKTGKTYGEIFKSNIFQFFNFVLYGIAILFLIFHIVLKANGYDDLASKYFGFSKYLFIGPATLNIIISIIQEIRSKHVLDKLRLVTETKITVIRDGEEMRIPTKDVVYGDLVVVRVGEQCPVDMRVVEGKGEFDESMLTGESETVGKTPMEGKNFAYGGSVLMSGMIIGLAIAVGADTYANQLSKKLKGIEKTKSELMRSIYSVINIMAFVLIAIVVLVYLTMMYKVVRWGNNSSIFNPTLDLTMVETWCQMTVTVSAFAIGVLPTGLVLVTSITLAASVIILARQNTLVQELYSLENLSRVDTICLDKTGTLTDGTMSVEEVVYYLDETTTKNMISTLVSAMTSVNQTGLAMSNYFGNQAYAEIKEEIPFSSDRKYSGAILKDGRTLTLGAPEYLTHDPMILSQASNYQKEGKRVLLFLSNGLPYALIILKDGIRRSAPETIAFFVANGVDVKIISGDNVETVSKIAMICGVPNADKAISLEGMPVEKMSEICMDYAIFGRVSPEQKEALVEALQAHGRKVAMTGDGVNDLLALRKANSSITFEKATDAAKSCADVVLLDNDFSHLKEVVGQGRKVVNNAQRSSILFLMKTFFIVMLSVSLFPFPRGHMVFSIENIYMLQTAIIAVGGFLLSLEPNTKKPIVGTFKENVFPKAMSAGLALLLGALVPTILNSAHLINNDNTTAMISILTTIAGVVVLARLSQPFTPYRVFVFFCVVFVAVFLALAMPKSYLGGLATSLKDFFDGEVGSQFFQPGNSPVYRNLISDPFAILMMSVYIVAAYPSIFLIERILARIGAWIGNRKNASDN